MLREKVHKPFNGLLMLLLGLGALLGALAGVITSANAENGLGVGLWAIAMVAISLLMAGLFTVNPNEARVLTLFGRYVGTVREAGLWYANPFYAKKRISLRVRNFETTKLKVNDNHSNPIEIGAVVVWRVDRFSRNAEVH